MCCCSWEYVEEHFGNFESPLGSLKKLMRTSGESFANSMGTLWEHQNSKKSKPLKNQLWNHLEE
jgi:hypothetical protein